MQVPSRPWQAHATPGRGGLSMEIFIMTNSGYIRDGPLVSFCIPLSPLSLLSVSISIDCSLYFLIDVDS